MPGGGGVVCGVVCGAVRRGVAWCGHADLIAHVDGPLTFWPKSHSLSPQGPLTFSPWTAGRRM
eukprot:15439148-Alexandrium_andersonii.AAC.1